jgi:hypothetical protein
MIAIMDILKSAQVIINRIQLELANVDLSPVEIDLAAIDILGADSMDHKIETFVAVSGHQPAKCMAKTKLLTINRPLMLDRARRLAMERANTQPAIGSLDGVRDS